VLKNSLGLYFFLLVTLFFFYSSSFIGFQWLFFGIASVFLFFSSGLTFPLKWSKLTDIQFPRQLFLHAFSLRLAFVFFSYFYFQLMTGRPFEYDAGDAPGYHGEAQWIVGLLKSNALDQYVTYLKGRSSDSGFPVYLSVFNFIFGETILIPRIVNAVLGAQTAVISYQLASRNFGKNIGRLAGILVMIMPSLIYYTGLHLKETLMVFILMAFLNQADKLIRERNTKFKQVFLIALFGSSLFFFRTVLGAAAFFTIGLSLALTHKKIISSSRRFAFLFLAGLFGLFLVFSVFTNEIDFYYNQKDTNLESQMSNFSNRKDGNKLAKYGSTAVFLPMILVAPLPTLVDTNQLNSQMIHGTIFVKNILAFFVILALVLLWKRKWIRFHLLLIVFMATYLAILVSSAFALSERYHLVIVPCFLILAAYGISEMRPSHKKYFNFYMVLLFFLLLGWNWFKLAGRDLG
jgi:4-amino-4-deoxy-L-arabinose transferase-like glycosyltransferase